MRDRYVTATTVIGALIFLTFIPIAIMNQTTGWIPDVILFLALTIFYYWTYDTWRMKLPILAILILGHVTHAMGIFGWYHISPIGIGWERVTHVLGSLGIGMLCYRFLGQWKAKGQAKRNRLVTIAIFLMALGLGAVVELTEFWGYLYLGHGEGALFFGPGDGVVGLTGSDLVDVVGGGWINEGWDMTFNSLGIIIGMIATWLLEKTIWKKREKEEPHSIRLRKGSRIPPIPEGPHSVRWSN